MIKIVDGNLFDSKANFLIHQVNCADTMGSGIAKQVANMYPHVESEYHKYIRYCKKNKINFIGTAQFVPVDHWALIMVDTLKNNNVFDYDKQYQYIVNVFGQENFGYDGKQYTNLKALKNALIDVRNKAQVIGATVALPYGFGSVRGGANWDDVYKIIKDVFSCSTVDVEIRKLDLG